MQYVISDAGVVAVTENSGTLQNVSNDKIEVSHSADFADCLIVLPLENLAFNSPIFARAVGSVTSQIAFNVVNFIADEVVSGSGTSSGVSGGAAFFPMRYKSHVYNYGTTNLIYWCGGELTAEVDPAANCTVSVGAASIIATGKQANVHYGYRQTPAKGTGEINEVTLRVAAEGNFPAQEAVITVATARMGDQITLSGSNGDSLKNIYLSTGDDNFTNSGDFCSIRTETGNDTVTNYGEGCSIISTGDSDTIANFADGCLISLGSKSASITNEGDYCSLVGYATVDVVNSGDCCSIYNYQRHADCINTGEGSVISLIGDYATINNSANHCFIICSNYGTIKNEGNHCSIFAGNSTINSSGKGCTISAYDGINISCNGEDVFFDFVYSFPRGSIFDVGANSTIRVRLDYGGASYALLKGTTKNNPENFFIGRSYNGYYECIFYGAAENNFVYEFV